MKAFRWIELIVVIILAVFIAYSFYPPKLNNLPARVMEDSVKNLKARILGYQLDSARIRLKMFTDSLHFAEASEHHRIEIKRMKNNVQKIDLKRADNRQLDSAINKLYGSNR